MGGIFKAYDIRGIYGRDLTEAMAEKIGRAFVDFLKCRTVVVGRDMRPHSAPLFQALAAGITRQGAEVFDLGLCSTPMSYYANGKLDAEAGIMVTASHNPGEWNGFKLSRRQAVPISGKTGIQDIEKLVAAGKFSHAQGKGKITPSKIDEDYAAHVRRFANLSRPVKVAMDFGNAMGIVEAQALRDILEITPLYDTLDGTFPHHEANPLKTETLADLQKLVRSGRYDFGVAFDGDADRVGFVDERGEIVPMDLSGALIAMEMLRREPGAMVLYDLRSSQAFKEVVAECGGRSQMCRVGHAFIKQQMRETNAIFAGELSGHYYFRDNFFTESSALAVICMANIVSRAAKPLSELLKPLRRYFKSPEINSEVHDPQDVLCRLKAKYADGQVMELDGLSVSFPDWWFNVRASNTEPLVRLNLEARSAELLEKRTQELLALIRAP